MNEIFRDIRRQILPLLLGQLKSSTKKMFFKRQNKIGQSIYKALTKSQTKIITLFLYERNFRRDTETIFVSFIEFT